MIQSWQWIISDPKICGGEPCVKGTRIAVHLLLDHIAAGNSFADLLKAYPQISKPAIQEALEYASHTVRQGIPPLR